MADATGKPWAGSMSDEQPVRLLVGPEGGWTGEELAAASRAGATIARFGVHTMRIEVAAVAACAVIMSRGTSAQVPAPSSSDKNL
jgi:16S rRNA (uracil1498-N3)-methyltransferase